MTNSTQLNSTTALSNNPLISIMDDVMRIDQANKAIPHMVAYCIMVANEDRRSMDKDAPTLRMICSMTKGDKSKQTDLLASLLLGFANAKELVASQADGQTVTDKDDDGLTARKENNQVTVAQYNAQRARVSRAIYEAADLIDAGVSHSHYAHAERGFLIPRDMWLDDDGTMLPHGALALADVHLMDGRTAYAKIGAAIYPFTMNTQQLVFMAAIRKRITEGKALADTSLARMLCKVNPSLTYEGQVSTPPATPQTDGDVTDNATPPTGDATASPVTPPQSDDTSTAPRGAEKEPEAYNQPYFRKLAADWISATTAFVKGCEKFSRPSDMVTDDFGPHYKDFKNTLAQLNLMHDAILENTARIDAEHAATVAANVAAAREKAFEKAPVSHTHAKSKAKVDKAQSAA